MKHTASPASFRHRSRKRPRFPLRASLAALWLLAALALPGCASEQPPPSDGPVAAEPAPPAPPPTLIIHNSSPGGLVTLERGGEATLEIALSAQPAAPLTFVLISSDPTEGTVSPGSVTFGPEDWDVPQTLTVTGVDDDDMDGNQPYTISVQPEGAALTEAAAPGGLVVAVTNADDEAPGISVQPLQTRFSEAGGSGAFRLLLNAEPDGDVTVVVGCTDPTEALLAGEDGVQGESVSATFTPEDWSTPRYIYLYGQDDTELDGDQVLSLSVTVDAAATTDTTGYAALAPLSAEVIVQDDETEWVTVEIMRGCTAQAD